MGAAADAIATGAMINGLCKTAQTPRRRSCLHHRPKPHGTAQQAMQVRLSAVALTPLGPPVAAADVTATGAMFNGLCKTARTPRRHSCSHHRPKPHGTAQQGTQVRLSAVAITPLVPPVAAADAIATVAMILVVCRTAQIPRRRSCLHHRPKPHGAARPGMLVRLSAVALTPLGPPVAAADAIATGAMINGLCKTARTPRRHHMELPSRVRRAGSVQWRLCNWFRLWQQQMRLLQV